MKIIKFKDGTYGIKKGWWVFTKFADVRDLFWWGEQENVLRWCKFSSLEQAKERLTFLDLRKWDVIE